MRMHQVRSAGFVLFRRARGARDTPLFLLMHSRKYRHWGFPKGARRKGENDLTAAIREVKEETGIEDFFLLPGFRCTYSYTFVSGGKRIRECVILFGAQTVQRKVKISREHTDFYWLGYRQASMKLAFKNIRRALDRFLVYLGENASLIRVQRDIYRVVGRVPEGKVTTYHTIAQALSVPPRLVGLLLSLNWDRSVPCHRVVHKSGMLGGYNRGIREKIGLLKKEGIHILGSGKNGKVKDFKRII